MNDLERSRALPPWGDAHIPADRDHTDSADVQGFRDVIKVFIRTWPFLITQVFGYWRVFPLVRSRLFASNDGSWSFGYVPPLVTALVAIGPLTGLLPYGVSWQLDLLLGATILMAIMIWGLILVRGRLFAITAVALVLLGSGTNMMAILAVPGWTDNFQVGLVSFGCLFIWLLQLRIANGEVAVRLRVGSHLVYYYILTWLKILIGIVTALFTIDLLNQSILQAEPLTPFLAGFIGHAELANGVTDTVTQDQRKELQLYYIIFIVAVGLLMFPFRIILPYYNVWILQRINQDLRLALVERWHQLSLRYHSDHRVGDSVYRIYQDSAQVTAIIGMVVAVMTQLMQYGMTVVFVAALDPFLGLMALTIAILALIWGSWFSPRMRSRSLTARETNSDLTSRIQEAFEAIRVIKAYGAEDREQARFESDSVVAFNAAYRVRSLVAVIGIVMFTLAAVILLGGEFMMAVWANQNRETFAAVLIGLVGLSFVNWNLSAFQWAQTQFLDSSNQVRGLLRQWTLAQDMAMGLDRVFNILDIEPDVKNALDAIPMPAFVDEIRFDDVGFAYEEDQPILKHISFTATPGSITAIVGPTGSGKSTLVGLLTRIFDPDSGRVLIDGNDLRQLEVDSLRANVSIALQENVLFAMSVRDNIRYVVPNADDASVREAARVACVDDYIDRLPEGLDTLLGDRGGRLSTGQRQRLSIARAVVRDAPILILDEPTAALDASTEHEVLERLALWGEGRAIFLITHRISTIQRANLILYLDQGEIIERGSHAELMTINDGRYRSFVEAEELLSQGPVGAADD